MPFTLRQLAWRLTLALAAVSPMAHAQSQTLLDFEGPDVAGLYMTDDYFDQSGFRMTQVWDVGIVGTGAGWDPVAPTNNTTQFYSAVNDGEVVLTRVDGGAFSLDGFSVAYIPTQGSSNPPETYELILALTYADGTFAYFAAGLGDTTSSTVGSPFFSYDTADVTGLSNLVSVDFFTCDVEGDQYCLDPQTHDGQFALDNLLVTAAVPEPTTTALLALGLAGLVVVRRGKRANASQGAC